MMNLIRTVLSGLILFLNRVFQAKPQITRTPERQALVNGETSKLAIYQFEGCPFCVKVRRAVSRLGLQIEYRDVRASEQFKKELLEGGGDYQVPCLRIPKEDGSVQWMYESSDIIQYLQQRFSA